MRVKSRRCGGRLVFGFRSCVRLRALLWLGQLAGSRRAGDQRDRSITSGPISVTSSVGAMKAPRAVSFCWLRDRGRHVRSSPSLLDRGLQRHAVPAMEPGSSDEGDADAIDAGRPVVGRQSVHGHPIRAHNTTKANCRRQQVFSQTSRIRNQGLLRRRSELRHFSRFKLRSPLGAIRESRR